MTRVTILLSNNGPNQADDSNRKCLPKMHTLQSHIRCTITMEHHHQRHHRIIVLGALCYLGPSRTTQQLYVSAPKPQYTTEIMQTESQTNQSSIVSCRNPATRDLRPGKWNLVTWREPRHNDDVADYKSWRTTKRLQCIIPTDTSVVFAHKCALRFVA